MVTQINRLRPAFAVVCGDLVDEFPDKDDDRRRRQALNSSTQPSNSGTTGRDLVDELVGKDDGPLPARSFVAT